MQSFLFAIFYMILGGVIGLFVREAYYSFRNRPQFKISNSFFRNAQSGFTPEALRNGDGINKGISVKVKNVGNAPIDDYDIILRGSKATFNLFETDKTGPLLARQERSHTCITERYNGKKIGDEFSCDWFGSADDATFQIVKKESDQVLFESKTLGQGIVNYILTGKADARFHLKIRPRTLKAWWEERKERIVFSKMIEEMDSTPDTTA